MLRYVREDCAPVDVEPRFFLHLTPRDLADLPPYRREHGFDNRDFGFAETGGFFWQGRCQAQFRLPGYPMAALRTGQYAAGAGELWAEEFYFPGIGIADCMRPEGLYGAIITACNLLGGGLYSLKVRTA